MVYELVPGIHRVNNQLNFRCPICGDSSKKRNKRRGHFYLNECSYFCWNAGCLANGKGLSGLQFLSAITNKTQRELKSELIKRANNFTDILYKQKTSNINDLFEDSKTVKNNHIVHTKLLDNQWCSVPEWLYNDVIKSRKLDKAPFISSDWNLYFDNQTNRLVIPWSEDYYQLRAITKEQEKNSGKYLFPPGIEKPIFGLDKIDPDFKYIFLLEGVFDSIFVKNGCAVGSLKLSNKQEEQLQQYIKNGYTIVYFMDNQYTDKSSYNETLKISKENPYINLFIWPPNLKNFKDVNDTIIYSDKFLKLWSNETFLTSRIYNGVKAHLILKSK